MSWFDGDEHQPFQLGNGPRAVLLIHGFMGTPAEMRPLGHALADVGYTAYGMLQPGFGPDMAWLSSLTVDQWIDAALTIWDGIATDHSDISLIGYSMGGPVALQIASRRAASRLVLIAPLWKLLGGDPKLTFLPVVRRFMKQVQPFKADDLTDPDVQKYVASSFPDVDLTDSGNREFIAEQMTLPTATIDEVRKLAATSADTAAKIQAMPLLIIQGLSDESIRAEDTRELLQHFSGPVTYLQVPGDHLLTQETKETWQFVREQVLTFLRDDPENAR